MIALKEIQPKTVELIAGNAYFAGETVLANDGTKLKEAEQALSKRGFCVLVHPVEMGQVSPENRAGTITPINCPGAVEVFINPKVNADVAQKNMMEALSAIAYALRGYRPVNRSDHYTFPDKAFEIIAIDPGIWDYEFYYNKQAIL